MSINDALRLIAGIMILLSVGLAVAININWLWLTAFVGVNLLQSAFTKWCPMMTILAKAGLKNEACETIMLTTIQQLVQRIRPELRCITADIAMIEVKQNNGVVIDVREPAEVAQAPTMQSINIPRGILEMEVLSRYPNADTPIYIHCATGARATLATEQLRRIGYGRVCVITSELQAVLNHQIESPLE